MYRVNKMVSLPIFEFNLNDHIDSEVVAEKCLSLKNDEPNHKPELVKNGWQSKSYNPDDINFINLCKIVTHKVSESSAIFHSILNYWFVIYDISGTQQWHRHSGDVAAVYYAKTNSSASPIIFENENSENLVIPVRQGYLYAWPANINHMVPSHNDTEQRIVVSFNLRQKHFNPYNSYKVGLK